MPNTDFGKAPLVSIIIPVFNGSLFLKEAIDSALSQTYSNYEVIVINDGSVDNGKTAQLANSYGSQIRYFEKANGGCASALNVGVQHMRGTFFSWLSHDDIYEKTKLESQLNALRRSDQSEAIVYSGYKLIDDRSRLRGEVLPDQSLGLNLEEPLLPLFRGLINGCTLLIPAVCFERHGCFDESLLFTQDYALWFKFLRNTSLVYDPHPSVRTRVHRNQTTHSRQHAVNKEGDSLWKGFLREVTETERIRLDGSSAAFFLNMENFLRNTMYSEAHHYAAHLATDALSRIKVSVIIPIRDRFKLAVEAIQSVQSQSHKNVEIIVIDDGSTKDCLPVVDLMKADSRISLHKRQPAGAASARNYGVSMATGDYIAFLDSDDLFEQNKLEEQLRFMEQSGWKASHTSYQRISDAGEPIDVVHNSHLIGNIYPDVIETCQIATPTVMLRRDAFDGPLFPEGLQIGEDVCAWITVSRRLQWGAMDIPLTRVRVNDSTAALNPKKQLFGLVRIVGYCLADPHISQDMKEIHALLQSAAKLGSSVVEDREAKRRMRVSQMGSAVLQKFAKEIQRFVRRRVMPLFD